MFSHVSCHFQKIRYPPIAALTSLSLLLSADAADMWTDLKIDDFRDFGKKSRRRTERKTEREREREEERSTFVRSFWAPIEKVGKRNACVIEKCLQFFAGIFNMGQCLIDASSTKHNRNRPQRKGEQKIKVVAWEMSFRSFEVFCAKTGQKKTFPNCYERFCSKLVTTSQKTCCSGKRNKKENFCLSDINNGRIRTRPCKLQCTNGPSIPQSLLGCLGERVEAIIFFSLQSKMPSCSTC